MDLITVVIVGLAGWRVASLLLVEAGPWEIFENFRKFIGIKPGPVTGFFPLLFTCVYCLGFWCALIMYLIYEIYPEATILLAASTVVIVVDKVVKDQ